VFVTYAAADINDPKRSKLNGGKLIIEVLTHSNAAFDTGDRSPITAPSKPLKNTSRLTTDWKTVDVFRKGPDGLWVLHPRNAVVIEVRFDSVGWVARISDLLGSK
jgi:hypothetical protein